MSTSSVTTATTESTVFTFDLTLLGRTLNDAPIIHLPISSAQKAISATGKDVSKRGLSKKNLTVFTPSMYPSWEGIVNLNLAKNRLRALPPEIGQLTGLRTLDLHRNELRYLPAEIGKLTNLSDLYVDHNELFELPKELGRLFNLYHFTAHSNHLTGLPAEIGNCTDLRTLFVHSNQIEELPDQITNLTELMELDVSGNQLTTLPSNIDALKDNMNEFRFGGNPFQRIPVSILQLSDCFDQGDLPDFVRELSPEKLTELRTAFSEDRESYITAESVHKENQKRLGLTSNRSAKKSRMKPKASDPFPCLNDSPFVFPMQGFCLNEERKFAPKEQQ